MANKGSSFERDISKYLSKWLTGKNNPMYGYKYTEDELEKRSNKRWIAYHKNGRKEIIKVMSIWCKNNDIPVCTLRRTLKTGRYCRKGWRIENG